MSYKTGAANCSLPASTLGRPRNYRLRPRQSGRLVLRRLAHLRRKEPNRSWAQKSRLHQNRAGDYADASIGLKRGSMSDRNGKNSACAAGGRITQNFCARSPLRRSENPLLSQTPGSPSYSPKGLAWATPNAPTVLSRFSQFAAQDPTRPDAQPTTEQHDGYSEA